MPTYDTATLVHISVTGSETQKWTAASNPDHAGEPIANLDAGGFYYGGGCYANVSVTYQHGVVGYCGYPGTQLVFDAWVFVSGTGSVSWNSRTPPYYINQLGVQKCGAATAPCFDYDSPAGFTVTLERPVPDLLLKPNRWVAVAGQSVQFAAYPSQRTFGGQTIPFGVTQWQYVPDSGAAVQACPGGGTTSATCNYMPTTSGTMHVTAKINGVLVVASTHIRVICSPSGDPVLDSLPMLDALRLGWDKGGADSEPGSQRKEEFVYVACDTITGICWPGIVPDTFHYPSGMPVFTPCRSATFTPGLADTNAVVVADGHDHPFSPWDSLPPGCTNGDSIEYQPGPRTKILRHSQTMKSTGTGTIGRITSWTALAST